MEIAKASQESSDGSQEAGNWVPLASLAVSLTGREEERQGLSVEGSGGIIARLVRAL